MWRRGHRRHALSISKNAYDQQKHLQGGLVMNISLRPAARRARAALVTTAVAGAGLAGVLGMGGVAHAATHAPNGYVVIDSCTGVSGKITYSPGLVKVKKPLIHAVMTGTTSGCADIFNGPESGTGTFTAVLSGHANLSAENFSGTFTINWPAGSGFNPSNGNLTVTESSGLENVSGSVTSGFDTGTAFAMQYVTTGNKGLGTALHPVTAQTYTNTQSLTLSRNEG
jgi:hypothetical protein